MRITIEKDGKFYVVKQGPKYGWVLEILTPVVKKNSKAKENKESLFFASLEQVAKKLTWYEVDASEVEKSIRYMNTSFVKVEKTLEAVFDKDDKTPCNYNLLC